MAQPSTQERDGAADDERAHVRDQQGRLALVGITRYNDPLLTSGSTHQPQFQPWSYGAAFKLVKRDSPHRGITYDHEGLYVDPNAHQWSTGIECAPGGIYFALQDDLLAWVEIYDGSHLNVRSVELPHRALVHEERGGKWRATAVVLGPAVPLTAWAATWAHSAGPQRVADALVRAMDGGVGAGNSPRRTVMTMLSTLLQADALVPDALARAIVLHRDLLAVFVKLRDHWAYETSWQSRLRTLLASGAVHAAIPTLLDKWPSCVRSTSRLVEPSHADIVKALVDAPAVVLGDNTFVCDFVSHAMVTEAVNREPLVLWHVADPRLVPDTATCITALAAELASDAGASLRGLVASVHVLSPDVVIGVLRLRGVCVLPEHLLHDARVLDAACAATDWINPTTTLVDKIAAFATPYHRPFAVCAAVLHALPRLSDVHAITSLDDVRCTPGLAMHVVTALLRLNVDADTAIALLRNTWSVIDADAWIAAWRAWRSPALLRLFDGHTTTPEQRTECRAAIVGVLDAVPDALPLLRGPVLKRYATPERVVAALSAKPLTTLAELPWCLIEPFVDASGATPEQRTLVHAAIASALDAAPDALPLLPALVVPRFATPERVIRALNAAPLAALANLPWQVVEPFVSYAIIHDAARVDTVATMHALMAAGETVRNRFVLDIIHNDATWTAPLKDVLAAVFLPGSMRWTAPSSAFPPAVKALITKFPVNTLLLFADEERNPKGQTRSMARENTLRALREVVVDAAVVATIGDLPADFWSIDRLVAVAAADPAALRFTRHATWSPGRVVAVLEVVPPGALGDALTAMSLTPGSLACGAAVASSAAALKHVPQTKELCTAAVEYHGASVVAHIRDPAHRPSGYIPCNPSEFPYSGQLTGLLAEGMNAARYERTRDTS